jgi:hypothetical protein
MDDLPIFFLQKGGLSLLLNDYYPILEHHSRLCCLAPRTRRSLAANLSRRDLGRVRGQEFELSPQRPGGRRRRATGRQAAVGPQAVIASFGNKMKMEALSSSLELSETCGQVETSFAKTSPRARLSRSARPSKRGSDRRPKRGRQPLGRSMANRLTRGMVKLRVRPNWTSPSGPTPRPPVPSA